MTSGLADFIEAGKALDVDERIEAAHALLLSVDTAEAEPQRDIDEAWDRTIDRRVTEIVTGTAAMVDGPEAHARLRAEFSRPPK